MQNQNNTTKVRRT